MTLEPTDEQLLELYRLRTAFGSGPKGRRLVWNFVRDIALEAAAQKCDVKTEKCRNDYDAAVEASATLAVEIRSMKGK